LDGRVSFVGRIDNRSLADLYARCLAVYYAPVDEDSGLVPYEAFLSAKPVITTSDAGGPLEVVADGRTGIVCEPTPAAVAEACVRLAQHHEQASELGRAGKALASRVTWDATIDRLLGA
jgi:glycosyltransferase involved in cell wall biosynthesis